MGSVSEAVRVSEHVYWVGAIDWAVRDFHGYSTNRGTTYNAYLILGDEIVLVDTVKAPFKDEMMSRIAAVCDPADIAHIVSNHAEMDHSGCLPEVVDMLKPKKVFASTMGANALKEHFHFDQEIDAVKDGGSARIGNMTLAFMETRMLHWPDSMMTYLADDELLFSQDGFGMHLASTERFDDEISDDILVDEAAKYYANILLPFSPLVTKLIGKVRSSRLSIKNIAPDHGPIWRKAPENIVGLYSQWAAQKPTRKAVVVYDTMWESTATMAYAVAEGLATAGATAKVMPLAGSHRSDVATELLEAGALIVGCSTLNNNVLPRVADVLTYVKGLKPRNLIGAAFGSYGWSGEAVTQVRKMLEEIKVKIIAEDVKVKYVPDTNALKRCRSLGVAVGERLDEICTGRQEECGSTV